MVIRMKAGIANQCEKYLSPIVSKFSVDDELRLIHSVRNEWISHYHSTPTTRRLLGH